jgi:hypothetical protein
MVDDQHCPYCGTAWEAGFLATSNGSGLFWSKESHETRLRPKGLEILVGTEFTGAYSANASASRCRNCGTIVLHVKK